MKKRYSLLIILACQSVVSQTINIPDPSFKTMLLNPQYIAGDSSGSDYGLDIDTNNDGEIQVSEAVLVTGLKMNTSVITSTNDILSLEGIQYFTNVKSISCMGNQLTSLDVSVLPSLEYLNCGHNLISSLNVSGLNHLELLWCDSNLLTTLNISGLPALKTVFCHDNYLTSLNLNELPVFIALVCSNNDLAELHLNNITTLRELFADGNMLTSMDLSGLSNLNYVVLDSNQFASIDISPLSSLTTLSLSNNPISELDMSGNPELRSLFIDNTLFTTIDCSATAIGQISCGNNPGLTSINVKNGVFSQSEFDMLYFAFMFENLPALTSICVDNGEQWNLNGTNYNSGGNAVVYTGENCDIVAQPMGVNEEKLAVFIVYPNPFTNELSFTSDIEISAIEILDLNGRIVSLPPFSINNNSARMVLEDNLQKGIYMLKASTMDGREIIQKIIKE
ncbi:leucine-rich repeat domain-containing protein [Flavobacterium sp. DGU11]|uniref:Leucine-rich repeat domain-containing protein n=1 Tax=Flavobacterium arundinis TaxID=3139143 RepID=A0ABU9I1K4_9FLAO